MDLNEIHKEIIADYLRFTKYQTPQRIKSIDYCFNTLLSCRVRSNEVYSGDEVKTLLIDLQDVIRGEVETELNDSIHTNVLLVQQLLAQAEEWHLTLTANINELENREKLAAIKLLEESFSAAPPKVNITVTQTKQVIPVEDRNVATALKAEIERLRSENGQLCSKITRLEAEVSSRVERDNNGISSNADLLKKLEQDLIAAQAEIRRLQENDRSPQHSLETSNTEQLQSVQEAMQKLSEELVSSKMSACEQTEKLRQDLEARESKLRQVQSNLLLAEKELDKKFQATSAYANMKKILLQKNNKIKNLRTKLEALGGADGGEDEEEDGDGSKVGFHV